MRLTTTKQQQKSKRAWDLPNEEEILNDIFLMLRSDDALLSQTLSNVLSVASFLATLAGLVLGIGLASLAFPFQSPNMLGALHAEGLPGLISVSKANQGPLFVALVSEFALLLISTAYFTLYPITRALLSQRRYSHRGVEYLLANVDRKQAILREILDERSSVLPVVFLIGTVTLPFLLLILGTITSLYSALLHIPG